MHANTLKGSWLSRTHSRAVAAVGLFALSLGAAHAQTNPYQKGPDPSSSGLNATSGPFTVSTASVSSFVSGFGGGTIYYPTQSGQYAVVAVSPGFTGTQSSISWFARRLATHGFVTIAIDTNSIYDQPASRATQLMAALRYVTNSASSTVRSRVDATRLGVAGHSMGGGGSLIAARDNPTLRATYPMTPWNTSALTFSSVRVPSMIIGAENDSVASVNSHAIPFYNALPSTLDKAYGELNGASHFAPNSTNTPIGRYGVTWFKRFMDNDTRYNNFLCGTAHQAYATSTVFSDWRSTCPF